MTAFLLAVTAASLASSPSVSISNFAGEIRIEQGETLSMRVEGEDASGLVYEIDGSRLVADGRQNLGMWSCVLTGDGWVYEGSAGRVRGVFANQPTLVVSVPEPAHLRITDSLVSATTSPLASLRVDVEACGRFDVPHVSGNVDISIGGDMDLKLGDIEGDASLASQGHGRAALGDVAGRLFVGLLEDAVVTAGDVRTADVRTVTGGQVSIGNAPGGVEVNSIADAEVSAGAVGSLTASLIGGGGVDVQSIDGPLRAQLTGRGGVTISEGRAEPAQIAIDGPGGVKLSGTFVGSEIVLNGSGNVVVDAVEGARSVDSNGQGRLIVLDED